MPAVLNPSTQESHPHARPGQRSQRYHLEPHHEDAFKCLRDYEAQKKAGREPEFEPVALGIKNAHYWEGRAAALKLQGDSARDAAAIK